jgi:hypothetical protein
MARMVTITITYDMDDEDKSLQDELRDWLDGNVNVQDIIACDSEDAVKITETPAQGSCQD